RMSKITLPTIPGMRVITNDCLSDGHAGILSHSLGGVISYDLFTDKQQAEEAEDALYSVAFPRTKYPQLKFTPSFLFALGSPIGAVMVMRGLRHEHFCLPKHVKFMNIFNPYDPLAYRIEPLIGEQYEGLDPVPIPICEIKDNTSFLPN
ncbi:S23-interacting protein, partial [Massospora cicadina]